MNGFTFFRNYYEAINDPENELTEEEQGRLYNAIFAYIFEGKEPELKGACKLAFNILRPSLDVSKTRGEARKSKSKEEVTESNENQTESKQNQNKSNENQNSNVIGFDSDLTFLEKKEERKEEIYNETRQTGARAREEASVFGAEYVRFMNDHPNIVEDIRSPSEIAGKDFVLLAQKISESSRILQQKDSLRWLLSRYDEIMRDKFRDFQRGSPPEKKDPDFDGSRFADIHYD